VHLYTTSTFECGRNGSGKYLKPPSKSKEHCDFQIRQVQKILHYGTTCIIHFGKILNEHNRSIKKTTGVGGMQVSSAVHGSWYESFHCSYHASSQTLFGFLKKTFKNRYYVKPTTFIY